MREDTSCPDSKGGVTSRIGPFENFSPNRDSQIYSESRHRDKKCRLNIKCAFELDEAMWQLGQVTWKKFLLIKNYYVRHFKGSHRH